MKRAWIARPARFEMGGGRAEERKQSKRKPKMTVCRRAEPPPRLLTREKNTRMMAAPRWDTRCTLQFRPLGDDVPSKGNADGDRPRVGPVKALSRLGDEEGDRLAWAGGRAGEQSIRTGEVSLAEEAA